MRYLAALRQNGVTQVLGDDAAIAQVFEAGHGLLWLHFVATDETDAAFLEGILHLHPLAVEDCLNRRYARPKVDDYGDFIFLTLHGIDYARTDETVHTTELDLFVGSHFVISSTVDSIPSIQHLADDIERMRWTGEASTNGDGTAAPSALAHVIVDALVDSVLPALDRMHEVTDLIEVDALERPDRDTLAQIQHLKRSANELHRVMGPQRELMLRISRNDYPLLTGTSTLFFRDVYDHLVRIEDLTSVLRERGDNALTTYLTAVNIRQNEAMRILATVAAIFLPLTLITGIYGMNFEHMPELGWRWAYPAVLALMFAIGLTITVVLLVRPWLRDRGHQRTTFAVAPHILNEALAEASRLRHRVIDAARHPRR